MRGQCNWQSTKSIEKKEKRENLFQMVNTLRIARSLRRSREHSVSFETVSYILVCQGDTMGNDVRGMKYTLELKM
jgi:hypothetical protein